MAKAVKTRLKQLRLNMAAQRGNDVTLKEVYDATGIAISTLSRIENNKARGIEFDTLVKLADFYEVNDIGQLLSLEEVRRALRAAMDRARTARRARVEDTGMAGTILALRS